MKTKSFYGVVFGGILLAACTAEDGLDSIKEVKNYNPASPVFTVSFDDEMDTRAYFNDKDDSKSSYGSTLMFEDTDLMSLYYGAATEKAGEGGYTGEDFKTYENAIYYGAKGDKGLVFATQAMVKNGAAIMMYPADQTFRNDGSNLPYVEISLEQSKETRHQTPYISEVIDVFPYNQNDDAAKDGKAQSGYGKTYDIRMKRVASLLKLNLETSNDATFTTLERTEQIAPLTVTSVAIKALDQNEEKKPFTSKASIAIGSIYSFSETANDGAQNHPSWVNHTVWSALEDGAEQEISTEDILSDGRTALLTLLPSTCKDDIEKATVTVSTTYGTITINAGEEKIWHKNNKSTRAAETDEDKENNNWTLVDGVKNALSLYTSAGTESAFYGSEIAGYGNRYLEVDLKDINMNGLHIKTEQQLIDVSKVLKSIGLKDNNNVFYLDGGENGHFTITSKAGYDAYEYIINYSISGKTVNLQMCDKQTEGHECEYVELASYTNDQNVLEKLYFGSETPVHLTGSWTLKGGREYQNVSVLEVEKDAKLTLGAGTIDAYKMTGNNRIVVDYEKAPVLRNRGEIDVTNVNVVLKLETENYGEINISGEGALQVSAENVNMSSSGVDKLRLTNMIDLPSNWNNPAYTNIEVVDNAPRGVINVNDKGLLSAIENKGAVIANYGIINVDDSEDSYPVILVDENEKGAGSGNTAEFDKPLSKNNVFGIVDYGTGKPNISSYVSDNRKGFLKRTLENINEVEEAEWTEQINYIVVKNANCTSVAGTPEKDSEGKKPTLLSEYLEIKSISLGATIEGRFKGVVVRNNSTRLNIAKNTTLSVSRSVYLEGWITNAGTFTNPTANKGIQYTGYMGGKDEDSNHVSARN